MTDSVQIFMPKTACVGDTAELRYIFHTDVPLLPDDQTHADVPTDLPAFVKQSDNCTVLSATLDKFGSEYTLSLTIVGWKPGQIDFTPFTIQGFLIDLDPVQIYSVVEKTGAQGFRPASPPLVVPGTTVVLGIFAVLFLIVLSGAIFALFHIPAIADFLTQSRAERLARRNMRETLKKLRALAAKSNSMEDKRFCAAIQHIMRGYLSKRFAYNFASVHTAALYETISDICGGDLADEQDTMVQTLVSLFSRTDFIRYAEGRLNEEERETLLATATDVVSAIGGEHAVL
ncbi:MAG: hypothetical protein IJS09_06750 [Treponema sp.]|nr:hypothetical protein [Treponema sp.]